MKKAICLLLTLLMAIGICACTAENAPDAGSNGSAPSEGNAPVVSDASSETGTTYNIPDESAEESNSFTSALRAAYEEAKALYEQDSELYRNPGALQTETAEMIKLEDGQWYQSFVYTTYNCRCVFLSNQEYEMKERWAFIPIGSAENAFLYNAGAEYDDPSGEAPYVEHRIAVRGVLSDAADGYAYMLQLPDELIVCIKGETGDCRFTETEKLFLLNDAAVLLDGEQGEVTITGVVMQDENGNLYLNDAALLS